MTALRDVAWRCAWLPAILLLLAGCSDVGDSTAIPDFGDDASMEGDDAADSAANDGTAASSDSESSTTPLDATALTDSPGGDATSSGTETGTALDAASDATLAEDAANAEDATADVVETVDANDASVEPEDSGRDAAPDVAVERDAATDATVPSDAGDAGEPARDASEDAERPDSGHDAGEDSGHGGGGPSACTQAPCSASGPNSVECPASLAGNNTCTPTEALIINEIDIPKNQYSGTQPNPTTSCYACLVYADCIDDTTFGDTDKECEDLPAGGSLVVDGTTTNEQACLNVLGCFIASNCVTEDPPSPCYCGTEVGTACATNPGNGPCVGQVIDGLGAITGDVCTGVPTSAPTPAGAAVCSDTTAAAAAAVNLAWVNHPGLPAGAIEGITGCGQTNCPTECGFQ